MKMKLLWTTVTFYIVLSLGYCLDNLLESEATLTINTPSSRVFVCVCSDAAECTADNWSALLAECRLKAENVTYEAPPATSASGVSSCVGLPDGDYASSTGCKDFVTCSFGMIFIRSCAKTTGWDDIIKTCVFLPTPTCA
ncbi:uncharacterized protein [Haliotis cracherodii]|uniref:uncharacterized protein n=1 Tax=Haliotis cracherodii TaxID=6455 RepID=UPI0039EA6E4F